MKEEFSALSTRWSTAPKHLHGRSQKGFCPRVTDVDEDARLAPTPQLPGFKVSLSEFLNALLVSCRALAPRPCSGLNRPAVHQAALEPGVVFECFQFVFRGVAKALRRFVGEDLSQTSIARHMRAISRLRQETSHLETGRGKTCT